MKVIVAQTAGYCTGVERAVDLVYEHADGKSRLYSIGPLIHNARAIEELSKSGLIVEENLENIEAGETVIIRSHGVPEELYGTLESKGVNIVDGTCAFVKKIHRLANDYSKKGFTIIIVGSKVHPEVAGILGWCTNSAFVVEEPAQVENLPNINKACVVAQTTINASLWDDTVRSLSSKIDQLQVFNTICNATSERQTEAQKIAALVSVMFIVGDKKSANTIKLYDLCKQMCPDTYHIESASEIDALVIKDCTIAGITGGASTPEWVINEVIEKVKNITPISDYSPLSANEACNAENAVSEASQMLQMDVGASINSEVQGAADRHVEFSNDDASTMSDDYEAMADFHKTMVVLKHGEIVKGTVISITNSDIIVNLGYKTDGILPVDEVLPNTFKPGDEGEFEIVKVNDGEGNVVLSRKSIEKRLIWAKIEESLNESKEIEGVCVETVKGGIIANVLGTIRAFVPASQVSTEFVSDLTSFVGKPMRLKIIEADKRRNRVVASQRIILESEMQLKRKAILDSIAEGDIVKGTVMRLTDFGVFVDMGGIDGLIRISDLSWKRVAHPKDILKPGQLIEVLVLSVNKEKEKISLGYKQLIAHPWEGITDRYTAGDLIKGVVARIAPFGAFVEIEPGVDGLVHISQISRERVVSVDKALNVGQEITAKILKIDTEQKKISLSIKEASESYESFASESASAEAGRKDTNDPAESSS